MHSLFLYTGWNDKIVILKKTTLQLYFKTFIEKINSGNLIMFRADICSMLAAFSLNHCLDTDPELRACLFHKCRWELGRWRRSGWLLCCGRSCWWCSQHMTKRGSPADSGRREASERRIQSRSTPSEAKPRFLWTCGLVPSPAVTPRVCHWPPNCTRGSPYSSAHPGTLWCWLSSRLRRCEVAWCGPHLKPHQRP